MFSRRDRTIRSDPDLGTARRSPRSVRAEGWDARGTGRAYRPRRHGGTLRGIVFLLLLAVALLGVAFVFAGPAFRDFALGMARDNPESLRIGPIADVGRGHLGDKLTRPAGDDTTPIPFEVTRGSTVTKIGEDLTAEGLIAEPMVAYLQTTDLTDLDAEAFHRLATQPPAELREDYPFLATIPQGRSLEGYLGSGVFELEPETDAGTLLRLLLDDWGRTVGEGPIARAREQGRDFYEVMTLASIVERETGLDGERRLVAGAYVNRMDPGLNRTGLINADPTVIYAN